MSYFKIHKDFNEFIINNKMLFDDIINDINEYSYISLLIRYIIFINQFKYISFDFLIINKDIYLNDLFNNYKKCYNNSFELKSILKHNLDTKNNIELFNNILYIIKLS